MAKGKKGRKYLAPAKKKGRVLPKKVGRKGSRFDVLGSYKGKPARRAFKVGNRGWYAISGWIVKGGKKKGKAPVAPKKAKGKSKGRSPAQKAATAKLVAANKARGKAKGGSSKKHSGKAKGGKKKGKIDADRQSLFKGLDAAQKAALRRRLAAPAVVYGPAAPSASLVKLRAEAAKDFDLRRKAEEEARSALRARLAARKAALAVLAGNGGSLPLPGGHHDPFRSSPQHESRRALIAQRAGKAKAKSKPKAKAKPKKGGKKKGKKK